MEAFQKLNQAWNLLVSSKTAENYETQMASMRTECPRYVMTYHEETWLIYKDRFVDYLLRGKLHFGNTTTSRVESAHATLRK